MCFLLTVSQEYNESIVKLTAGVLFLYLVKACRNGDLGIICDVIQTGDVNFMFTNRMNYDLNKLRVSCQSRWSVGVSPARPSLSLSLDCCSLTYGGQVDQPVPRWRIIDLRLSLQEQLV